MKTYQSTYDDTCIVQAHLDADGRYSVVYPDGETTSLTREYFERAYTAVPGSSTKTTHSLPTQALLAGMASPVAHPFVTDETDARRVILNISQGDFMAVVKYLLVAELREDEDHGDLEEVTDRIFGQLDETAEMLEPNYAMGLA